MYGKSRILLLVIGFFCAAFAAALMLHGGSPAAIPETGAWPTLATSPLPGASLGPAPILIGIALLAGLAATWLTRADRNHLHAEKHAVEIALKALPDAVIRLDANGRVAYFNPAGAALLGTPTADAAADWQLIDRETRAPILDDLLAAASRQHLAKLPTGARLLDRHGIEREVEGTCHPLNDTDTTVGGYLLHLRDVTEAREWQRRQPDLWDRDPVTALPGRAYLETRLARALRNRRTGDLPMTYLCIAIPTIGEVYHADGDAAGDDLVRRLTALLRAGVRDADIVARQDSDRFAVLLCNCPPEIGRRLATELRAALDAFRFEWAGNPRPVTAYFGQVVVPPYPDSLDDLLDAARPAMT